MSGKEKREEEGHMEEKVGNMGKAIREADRIHVEFQARGENESFARMVIGAFALRLDPTLEELDDLKTAVSEAVTNSIVHGYQERDGLILMESVIEKNEITVQIVDFGIGIEDVEKARQPLFTTAAAKEHSGMGFTVMEVFTDEIKVESEKGEGTSVWMRKKIAGGN